MFPAVEPSAATLVRAPFRWVRVLYFLPNKEGGQKASFFFWCGQQDSNLHALAVEPKSTESTNSTMPAYSFVPLIFTRGGTRGGAFRLIHDL